MGGARNRVHLVTAAGVEDWPELSKAEVAERLVARIAAHSKSRRGAGRCRASAGGEPLQAEPFPVEPEPAPEAEPSPSRLDDGSLDIRPTR